MMFPYERNYPRKLVLPLYTAYSPCMKQTYKELREFAENSPFHRFLGISIEDLRPGFAQVSLPFKEEFRGNETLQAQHGGVVAALVDICAAISLWTHFGPQDKTATIDMRVDYQRPAPCEKIFAEGEVRMLGNRIANMHVRVYAISQPDTLIAEGRTVYYVKRNS